MLTRLLKIRVQITWNWELRVLLNGLGQIQRMGLFILKLARHGQCGRSGSDKESMGEQAPRLYHSSAVRSWVQR